MKCSPSPQIADQPRFGARAARLPWLAATGFGLWLILMTVQRPAPLDGTWADAILAFAALVVVPLGLGCLTMPPEARAVERGLTHWTMYLLLPAAVALMFGLFRSSGYRAALLAAPWTAITGMTAAWGASRLWRYRRGSLAEWLVAAGMLYLAVGGGWTMLDRWGFRPLGFDRAIVQLTAIHFHYAGFALPLLTGLADRRTRGRLAEGIGVAVVASVPLVAVGITATQLGADPIIETVAALAMGLAGLGVAGIYLRLTVSRHQAIPRGARIAWGAAAVLLTAGMVLALLYAVRFYLPIGPLDIPWMRATHGSLNAFGFTLPALLGWRIMFAAEHSSSGIKQAIRTTSADPQAANRLPASRLLP